MFNTTHEEHGIHVECPSSWRHEVSQDGPTTTIEVEDPSRLAFAWVRTDESRPGPDEVADEALEALREEYPELDAVPVREDLGGHAATGHDVEFFSLDVTNGAIIRCFRTPRRTVLFFGQWSDIGDEALPDAIRAVLRSVVEIEG